MKSIIGRKMGMTQVYAEDGTMYAVTVIEVLPNVVTLKKTLERDGYEAIQVGYEDKKESRVTNPLKGIYKKAGVSTKEHLYELKGNEKLLYGEITALSNREGYCTATNTYFSKLYGKHKDTIQEWISKLKRKGYIETQLINKTAKNTITKKKKF